VSLLTHVSDMNLRILLALADTFGLRSMAIAIRCEQFNRENDDPELALIGHGGDA
jgi:hypothetical protein